MLDIEMFTFSEPATTTSGVTRVVAVPRTTTTKDELMSILAKGLDLPDYFGSNWDALEETLRDLSWLRERTIVIKHDGVPRMPADMLHVYLDVLAGAVRSWRGEGRHQLVVSFPASARDELTMIRESR